MNKTIEKDDRRFENEIKFEDLEAEVKGWWEKSKKERYDED